MEPDQFQALSNRVAALEARAASMDAKLTKLVLIFERGSGAWWLMRWLGALLVGGATLWAVIGEHIHWK